MTPPFSVYYMLLLLQLLQISISESSQNP